MERHYHTIVRQLVQQFLNVSFTLATRSQKWQACTLFDWSQQAPVGVSLQHTIIKQFKNKDKQKCPTWVAELCGDSVEKFEVVQEFFQTGVKVKQGLWIDISTGKFYDNMFGEVIYVLKSADGVTLCLQEWKAEHYNPCLGAFTVTKRNKVARAVHDIGSLLVVPIVRHDDETYVVPKFSTTTF